MIDALASWYPGHRVLDVMVIMAATVSLVSAAGWAISRCLGRRPEVRYGVVLSALLASLASPIFAVAFVTSGMSFINVPLLAADETASRPARLPGDVEQARDAAVTRGQERSTDSQLLSPVKADGAGKHESIAAGPAAKPAGLFRSAVVCGLLIWLCGALIAILGLFRSALALFRLHRSARPIADAAVLSVFAEARKLLRARASPLVGQSALARAPLAAGFFRPVILMPPALVRSISRSQLRDVFAHELAHIARRDQLVVLLQTVARALYWPIPFVHLVNRQLEQAREEVCDNYVLACRDAVSYSETLLRVAQLACRGPLPAATVGILHWRGKLEDRIFGLVDKGRNKMTRMNPMLAGAVIVAFLSASVIVCGTSIVQRARGGQPPTAEAPASPTKTRTEYVPPTAATKTGSAKTAVAKPTPEEERQREKALDALAKVYTLKPNEALKSFSPRFPPERGAYLDALYPQLPHAGKALDGYIWIGFTWKDGLKYQNATIEYKNATVHSTPAGLGRRVLDVMTSLLDCPEQEIEGDETLLSKGIAADFVVRDQAPPEKIVEQLAAILKQKFNLPVKISVNAEEREVFVMKGTYKPNPASAGLLEIYGHEIIAPDLGGGGDGTFRELLGHVGDWIKRRIVAEVEGAPDHVSWHFNWRAPFTKELLAEDQNSDSVMKHLGEQTGLKVSKEKRRVRVFVVEALK